MENQKKIFVGRIDFYANGQISIYEQETGDTIHYPEGTLNGTESVTFSIPNTEKEIEFKLNQFRVNPFLLLTYRVVSFFKTLFKRF